MEKLMRSFNKLLKNLTKIMFAATFALVFQACGGADQEASQLHRAIGEGGTGGTSGGKCKVVSGPNKGKTGTYDGEGWCTGDWGGTECVGSDGKSNGKCQDVKKVIITRPIDVSPVVIGTRG
jgi:hypothetical protein